MATDAYAFWRKALAQGSYAGLPLHETEPHPGYYRARNRDGRWGAVAIYPDRETGDLIALHDGTAVDPLRIWTWCLKYPPITYELYKFVEDGGQWPDQLPPMIGSNSGEDLPPEALMAEAVSERAGQLSAWLKQIGGAPRDDQEEMRLGNFQRFFTEQEKQAQCKRLDEVRPHLDAQKAVNTKWTNAIEAAKAAKERCEAINRAVLRRKREAAEAEARRKAEEAARAAARARPDEPPPPVVIEAPAPVRIVTDGRALTLRAMQRAQVTDIDKLIAHYARDSRFRDHPDVRKLLERFAKADLLNEQDVPGAILVDDERAA